MVEWGGGGLRGVEGGSGGLNGGRGVPLLIPEPRSAAPSHLGRTWHFGKTRKPQGFGFCSSQEFLARGARRNWWAGKAVTRIWKSPTDQVASWRAGAFFETGMHWLLLAVDLGHWDFVQAESQ